MNKVSHSSVESRKDTRVTENRPVTWHIKEKGNRGEGRIRNISTSGMMLETNTRLNPEDALNICFDAMAGENNIIPPNGRLIWSKKKAKSEDKFLSGIEFTNAGDAVINRIRQRVDTGIRNEKIRRFSVTSLSILTFVGILSLTAFIIATSLGIYQTVDQTNQDVLKSSNEQAGVTRTYVGLYNDTKAKLAAVTEELNLTKQLYQDSQEQLTSVSKELEATKLILAQTEELLAQVRHGGSDLKREVAASAFNEAAVLKAKEELTEKVAMLEYERNDMNEKIKQLQEQLQYYEGNIKNIEEGKALIQIYRTRLKIVQSKIKGYKQEAQMTRIAAQKERDKLRLQLGNNGYLVRNGEAVKVDWAKYNAAGSTIQEEATAAAVTPSAQNVKVNVTFVE